MRQSWMLVLGLTLVGLVSVTGLASDAANLLENHDFELGVDLDGVPVGWTVFAQSETTGFDLTGAYVTGGSYALRLWDHDTTRGAGLRSGRVPGAAGNVYVAETDVLVESGRSTLYLDFLDAEGRRIEARTATAAANTSWQRLEITAEAPANTQYVTIILYSNVGNTGIAYFDNTFLAEVTP